MFGGRNGPAWVVAVAELRGEVCIRAATEPWHGRVRGQCLDDSGPSRPRIRVITTELRHLGEPPVLRRPWRVLGYTLIRAEVGSYIGRSDTSAGYRVPAMSISQEPAEIQSGVTGTPPPETIARPTAPPSVQP